MEKASLEKLAFLFCSDFLKLPQGKNHQKSIKSEERILQKVIGLYGAKRNTLILIKDYMQQYFAERNEKIEVLLHKKGYEINVGYFLKNFMVINNSF